MGTLMWSERGATGSALAGDLTISVNTPEGGGWEEVANYCLFNLTDY